MILPPIIIRGETLILQAVVFNYMNKDLTNVDVTFLQTESFSKFNLKCIKKLKINLLKI